VRWHIKFSLFLAQILFLSGPFLAQAQTPSSQIVPFRKVGQKVEFSQPQGSVSFSLQSQVRSGAPWATIKTTPANGSSTMVSLSIPPGVRYQNLRVVALVGSATGQRKPLSFALDRNKKFLTFKTIRQARLYSVEYYQPSKKVWSRVSTVAGSDQNDRAVRVNLPPSLGKIRGLSLRVAAVIGDAPASADLSFAVSSALRSGVHKFSARTAKTPASPGPLMGAASKGAEDAVYSSDVAVEEADVWKVRGRKIYIFNQLRGLQVVNTVDPKQPEIIGSWSMPAVGEDLYLLGPSQGEASGALLLTQIPWQSDQPAGTRLIRLGLNQDTPTYETSIDLSGSLQESRLIGDRLHLITTSWQDEQGNWSPNTFLITLDISQNGLLVEESRKVVPYYASVVGSTDHYLWLAGSSISDWSRHDLTAYPIQANGSLGDPQIAKLDGVIQDKFKVGEVSNGLAAVVQSWKAADGSWQNQVVLETYAFGGSGEMSRLAQLDIIQSEWLYATRFDGNRLYAVTFRQVDPLWLIDLSDPVNPAITGHLEVPGWSTFIEPIGNLLVAVGRESGQVSISLFDVSNRTAPQLASRINLGDSGYSWSEAEWNEKAVKILPESGLILVPLTELKNGAWSNSVRILGLNLTDKTVSSLGTIQHSFSPRRSTLLEGDEVASISNRELVLVDVRDRTAPALQSVVTLAFGVDRLAISSGYLYQFENANSWTGGSPTAMMRVAPANDPDAVVAEIPMAAGTVSAAQVFGNQLIVVEGGQSYQWGLWMRWGEPSATSDTVSVSVWSLQNPSLPTLSGRVSLPGSVGGEVAILQASSGIAAITRKSGSWNIWSGRGPVVVADARIPSSGWNPYGYSTDSLNVDVVRLQGNPAVLGSWSLNDANIDSISQVYAFGDLLVLGYEKKETTPVPDVMDPIAVGDGLFAVSLPRISSGEFLSWQKRCWLQVLDLADPTVPSPWAPVELPGSLLGVSWLERGGGVLFTRSGLDDNGVYALGFDGEKAAVAAKVDVGSNHALVTSGNSVYAAGDETVLCWNFSDGKSLFGTPVSWAIPTPGPQQLELIGKQPFVLSEQALYRLDPGVVTSLGKPPGWPSLGLVRSVNGTTAIPTGDYGTFLAQP
jgi:Beta propeller domain